MTDSAPAATHGSHGTMLWASVVVLLSVGTVVGLGSPLLELPQRIARNHNEGWNAHHASRALSEDELYPDRQDLISNNYPPLSFYVVGHLGRWVGDNVLAGRMLSLLSLIIVATVAAFFARAMSGSTVVGITAGLLLLATIGSYFQNYVAMNDPQMLGHALQYLGLAALLRDRAGRRGVVACAFLVVVGGLVKHILLAVPLGLTVWLWREKRERFRLWLFSVALLTSAALGTLLVVFGIEAFVSIFRHSRTYGFHLFAWALERWILPISPLLIAALGVTVAPGGSWMRLMATIGGLSLAIGAAASFAQGVNYNAIFDAVFAAAVLGAVVMRRLLHDDRRVRWLWPILVCAPVILPLPLRALEFVESATHRDRDIALAAQDLEWIGARPGRALCEDSALSYWTERPFELDFFSFRQKRNNDVLDGTRLIERMETRAYSVIQLSRPTATETLGPDIQDALERNYELARHSPVNGWFFVPRVSSDSPATPEE